MWQFYLQCLTRFCNNAFTGIYLCFFWCSLDCPLDVCILRRKIMIASNFSRKKEWESNKGSCKIFLPLRLFQWLPKYMLIYGHLDLYSVLKRTVWILRSWGITWKAASLESHQLSTFIAFTVAWRKKNTNRRCRDERKESRGITHYWCWCWERKRWRSSRPSPAAPGQGEKVSWSAFCSALCISPSTDF